MRDPKEHIAAIQAAFPDSPPPVFIALLSDYASAYGYIEGSQLGHQRLIEEVTFWKNAAMTPVKTRKFVQRKKS